MSPLPGSAPRRGVPAFALTAALAACSAPRAPADPDAESPPASVYAQDVGRPVPPRNPAFVPVRAPVELHRSALRREGEVLVLEGEPRFVSSNGLAFGITEENTAAIIQEVLANYPDEFDTIEIHLSFLDEAHAGSAYYQPIKTVVQGVGLSSFDNRGAYGLGPDGRLTGFVNMNDMRMWGSLDTLTTPRGYYYAVMAQELSHRWLMFLKFRDSAGNDSDALLGRQAAHWSALVHAYGSCQDGVFWQENGDGSFTHMGESDRGWAPADKYAMGIIGRDAVEPWFYLVEASLNGQMLGRESHRDLSRGARVQARKISVTIDDVIASLGPRNPPVGTESPYYRAALVLVTAPGQPEMEWRPYLETTQRIAAEFPATWKEWTGGAGAICMKVSERCPEPKIGLERATVQDGNDGYLAPGERFELEVALRNDGVGTTRDLSVALAAVGAGVTVETTAPIVLPELGERAVASLPSRYALTVAPETKCGAIVQLRARATTEEGPSFEAPIELPVGTKRVKHDEVEEDADWTVDPDGDDDATAGAWGLGAPDFVSILGLVTQPAEDHSPGEGKLAFFTGPRRGPTFSSNDLDGGKTTLESPVYALGETRDPTLVFYAWHFAEDLANASGPAPVEGAELVVSASNDGGASWVELGKISGDTQAWTRQSYRLKDKLRPTNRMRFRFVIADTSTPGTVEAGIDDLEVIDVLESCPLEGERPDGGSAAGGGRAAESGCACVASRRGPLEAAASGALALGFALARAARRRRAAA